MKRIAMMSLMVLGLAFVLGITGCKKEEPTAGGVAEDAGEVAEEAAEGAGEALEDAGEALEGALPE